LIEAQTPLFRLLVDLLDNKLYNKLYTSRCCRFLVHLLCTTCRAWSYSSLYDESRI